MIIIQLVCLIALAFACYYAGFWTYRNYIQLQSTEVQITKLQIKDKQRKLLNLEPAERNARFAEFIVDELMIRDLVQPKLGDDNVYTVDMSIIVH